MTKRSFLLVMLIAGIFQATGLRYFRIFGAGPDFIIAGIVLAGIFFELQWAVFFAILAGLFKDAFGLSGFGINTFLFALWSVLVIKISRQISLDNNYIRAALIFLIVIINDIITRLLFLYFGSSIPVGIFLRITFVEAMYTALASPLIFEVSKRVKLR